MVYNDTKKPTIVTSTQSNTDVRIQAGQSPLYAFFWGPTNLGIRSRNAVACSIVYVTLLCTRQMRRVEREGDSLSQHFIKTSDNLVG